MRNTVITILLKNRWRNQEAIINLKDKSNIYTMHGIWPCGFFYQFMFWPFWVFKAIFLSLYFNFKLFHWCLSPHTSSDSLGPVWVVFFKLRLLKSYIFTLWENVWVKYYWSKKFQPLKVEVRSWPSWEKNPTS